MATELLCIKEDCYTNTTANYIKEATDWINIYNDEKEQYFMVIYDDSRIDDAVQLIKTAIPKTNTIKVYIFTNGQYPYTEEFEEVLEYVTLCALPDAIYKAYQNVLPKKHKKAIPELEEEIETDEPTLF